MLKKEIEEEIILKSKSSCALNITEVKIYQPNPTSKRFIRSNKVLYFR